MNDMTRYLLLIILIVTPSLHAQDEVAQVVNKQTELTAEHFDEAKVKYKVMLDSPSFQKSDNISKLFASHLVGLTSPNLGDETLFIPWIKENIHLTSFTSLDKVITLRNTWKEASAKVTEENMELYKLMSLASLAQIVEITKPYVEMTQNYFSRYND